MVQELKNQYSDKKLKKILIVGNGFDLNLGLKTKYTNFIVWLLQKQFPKFNEIFSNLVNDDFQYFFLDYFDSLGNVENISLLDLTSYCEEQSFIASANGYFDL